WILVAAVMLLAGLVAFAYSTQRYRRILRAHQGLLRDKAVLLEAWYANPGNQAASPHEDILRSYMHDIEGGLKVSAHTLKLPGRATSRRRCWSRWPADWKPCWRSAAGRPWRSSRRPMPATPRRRPCKRSSNPP